MAETLRYSGELVIIQIWETGDVTCDITTRGQPKIYAH